MTSTPFADVELNVALEIVQRAFERRHTSFECFKFIRLLRLTLP
jgi:hypothetical protein